MPKHSSKGLLIKTNADTNKEILVSGMAAALLNRLDQKLPERAAETMRRKLGVAKVQTTNLDGC